MLTRWDELAIELNTETAPFRYHGLFLAQDDEYIKIKGTLGEDIDKRILVVKSLIKSITIVAEASEVVKNYSRYWEGVED